MEELNLTSPKVLHEVLDSNGLKPNHDLGQNFLIDGNILASILESSGAGPSNHVLEVGPGAGVLTQSLLKTGARVTAVEKDSGMYEMLRRRWGTIEKLKLIAADALDLNYSEIFAPPDGADCLISNLPYSVGTRVIIEAAMQKNAPRTMVVLVQREVADRFVAGPGTEETGTASVWLQTKYDIEVIRTVKPTCFWPKPEVTSAVVRFKRNSRNDFDDEIIKRLMMISRVAFQHRRKQMASLYKHAPGISATPEEVRVMLESCGATAMARAEELSVDQWMKLSSDWPKK